MKSYETLLLAVLMLMCMQTVQSKGFGGISGLSLAIHKKSQSKLNNLASKRSRMIKNVAKVESTARDTKLIKKQEMIQTGLQLGTALGSMYLNRQVGKLDFKNKTVIQLCRAAFVAYIAAVQALQWFLIQLIRSRNNRSVLQVPDETANPLAALLDKANAGSSVAGNSRATRRTTVKDYDLAETAKMFSTVLPEVLLVTVLHFGLKYNKPLLYIPLALLGGKLQSPLVQIHLYGLQPVGTLSRPFTGFFDKLLATTSTVAAVDSQSGSGSVQPDAADFDPTNNNGSISEEVSAEEEGSDMECVEEGRSENHNVDSSGGGAEDGEVDSSGSEGGDHDIEDDDESDEDKDGDDDEEENNE